MEFVIDKTMVETEGALYKLDKEIQGYIDVAKYTNEDNKLTVSLTVVMNEDEVNTIKFIVGISENIEHLIIGCIQHYINDATECISEDDTFRARFHLHIFN